jgi:TolB-like protein/DNA-binding SARP family transcriptional activator
MCLRLRVLGEFDACDEAGRPVAIAAKKNRALLAALALAPACTMRRQRIAGLLWSDRDEAQARSSLRQALVALREDLAGNASKAFSFGEERVTLDPSRVQVDALEFARLAGADDIVQLRLAAALYRGELLADTEIKDRKFETWVAGERQRLINLAVGVLDKLRVLESGAARVDVARRLVALDPVREESHLKLMIALAETGERVAALRQYGICRETLRTELDAVPGEEIEALRRRLSRGTMDRVGSSKEAISSINTVSDSSPGILRASPVHCEDSSNEEPSIAVLPFDPMGDASLETFCDGLTEDIISGLARIKAIRVVARYTMLTYKRRVIDIREIAREVGARYVLEGSVRKSATQARVTAQLIDAASGRHIWAKYFDGDHSDGLGAQDEFTRGIVSSVQTQVILSEGRTATIGISAHESVTRLLARSWQQLLRLTAESLAESRLLAERALQLEGDSGMGHRMLAVALYHQAVMGFIPWTGQIIDEIYAHARIAVESEDADEYSHWAMLCAQLLRCEHERAAASMEAARAINPNCSLVHGALGTVLAWAGKSDLSIEQNELALRINPDDPSIFFRHFGLALAHYLAARYDKSLVHANAVRDSSPGWWLGLLISAASLGQMGRLVEAKRVYEDLKRIRPELSGPSLGMLPFANPTDRAHLLAGLRKAGLQD